MDERKEFGSELDAPPLWKECWQALGGPAVVIVGALVWAVQAVHTLAPPTSTVGEQPVSTLTLWERIWATSPSAVSLTVFGFVSWMVHGAFAFHRIRKMRSAYAAKLRSDSELKQLFERDPQVMLARQLCEVRERLSDATQLSAGDMLIHFLVSHGGKAGEEHLKDWLLFMHNEADERSASSTVYGLMRELAANDLVEYEPQPGVWVAGESASDVLPYVRAWLRDHAKLGVAPRA